MTEIKKAFWREGRKDEKTLFEFDSLWKTHLTMNGDGVVQILEPESKNWKEKRIKRTDTTDYGVSDRNTSPVGAGPRKSHCHYVLVVTGCHRRTKLEELIQKLGVEIVEQYQILAGVLEKKRVIYMTESRWASFSLFEAKSPEAA